MKKEQIIELGTKLGLPFNIHTNYPFMLEKDYVVFDGCNGQRFSIDGQKETDDEIYKNLGKFLILMGKRQKCLEISKVLSITGD
jgi:hypothetical protein